VGRGAEAIPAKAIGLTGDAQCAPADEAGTGEGRERLVGTLFTQREREACVGDPGGGEPAIPRIAVQPGGGRVHQAQTRAGTAAAWGHCTLVKVSETCQSSAAKARSRARGATVALPTGPLSSKNPVGP